MNIYRNANADLAYVGSEKTHTLRWGNLSAPQAGERTEESFTSGGTCLPFRRSAR